MLNAMKGRGVDTSPVIIDPQIHTGLSVILSRGADRAILTYPGAMAALAAEQVTDDLLCRSRHLHVASYFLQTALQPDLPRLFERAHANGLTVSLDPNWDPTGCWSGFQDLLQGVDVFMPNRAEALAITGTEDLSAALDRLSTWCPVLAVKLGAEGGVARQGRATALSPSIPGKVVDTVGAGDSFDGGFLYGYLNNWPLEKSLSLACACGSLSTRQPGGTNGQPTLAEALQALEQG
jgi:sugar/nucleoside kinase (ribokinase family)